MDGKKLFVILMLCLLTLACVVSCGGEGDSSTQAVDEAAPDGESQDEMDEKEEVEEAGEIEEEEAEAVEAEEAAEQAGGDSAQEREYGTITVSEVKEIDRVLATSEYGGEVGFYEVEGRVLSEQILPTYSMRAEKSGSGGTFVYVFTNLRVKKDGSEAIVDSYSELEPDIAGASYLLKKDAAGWRATNQGHEIYWYPPLDPAYDQSWFNDPTQHARIVEDPS